jgi:hypothetical protein
MTASTTITCTKSEFADALKAEFAGAWDAMRQDDYAEFQGVCDGLVKEADNHRGTFEGYNAYLDLDYIVTPDETKCADCDAPAVRVSTPEYAYVDGEPVDVKAKPRCERHARPAVSTATRVQRTANRAAAYEIVRSVSRELSSMADSRGVSQGRLALQIDKLVTALGHLTLADGES